MRFLRKKKAIQPVADEGLYADLHVACPTCSHEMVVQARGHELWVLANYGGLIAWWRGATSNAA